jgi:hypothetical protein
MKRDGGLLVTKASNENLTDGFEERPPSNVARMKTSVRYGTSCRTIGRHF